MADKDDRPELREKIAQKLYAQRWYEGQPSWEESQLKQLFRNYALQIITLIPKDNIADIFEEIENKVLVYRPGTKDEPAYLFACGISAAKNYEALKSRFQVSPLGGS